MRAINYYMREKNIEYELQVKVRKYLNFIFDKTDNTEKGKDIINKLSNSLKEEVLIRANGTIIKNIPLFSKNFSEESLRKTVFLMKNIKFYPEEVIYEVHYYLKQSKLNLIIINKKKDGVDRFLYLICDGEIDICMDSINKRHNIKKLKVNLILKNQNKRKNNFRKVTYSENIHFLQTTIVYVLQ